MKTYLQDKNMELREKAKIAGIFTAVLWLSYVLVGYFLHSFGTPIDLMTDLDRMIPYIPAFSWIYASWGFLLAMPVFLVSNKRLFYNILAGISITVLIADIVYLNFPSHFPRIEMVCDSIANCIMTSIHAVDPANNTFPSLHVALSWVVALFLKKDWDEKLGSWFIGWAILISISVVFVRQHFLIDVFAGYMLARFSRYVVLTANSFYDKIKEKYELENRNASPDRTGDSGFKSD